MTAAQALAVMDLVVGLAVKPVGVDRHGSLTPLVG